MVIKKLTAELIDKIIIEFKKEENKNKINTYIIDPTIYYILDRLYPYIFITATIFILIFIITIMTLLLTFKKNKN